tara:strand:+ start:1273 stop:1476 length:204 start_codon:yes stop_codon:yes gene_type:complete
MTILSHRLEKLEERDLPEPGPVFLLVDKAKGESVEAAKAAYLAEHPDAIDEISYFVVVLNGGNQNDQ